MSQHVAAPFKYFGVSSYFLWTQKGKTFLPLVRGSGFMVKYDQVQSFFHHHVLTASHVCSPGRHKAIFGNTAGLKAIGERHVSSRILLPPVEVPQAAVEVPPNSTSEVLTIDSHVRSYDLRFGSTKFPNVDVATLRMTEATESSLLGPSPLVQPLEIDREPIGQGDELVLCGMLTDEERANPTDDGAKLKSIELPAVCHAAMLTIDYGTVLLATCESLPPASMCGGPVLRKRTGTCVGVLVAPVRRNAPPKRVLSRRTCSEEDASAVPSVLSDLIAEPWLDVSQNKDLLDVPNLNAAFVPFGEFYPSMRRAEM